MQAKYNFLLVSFLFSITMLNAQQKMNTYQRSWREIDSLAVKKGLVRDALKEVNVVYLAAKKENNDAQQIKSLVYRLTLEEQLSEESAAESIAALEKESASSKEPARSILYSITAEAYWNYLQQNRWKFYNRTATTGLDKGNIATWDITYLHQKITELYTASLRNAKLLQQTSLQPFDPIITKGNARTLRPTLYDLLGHRALDYYKNNERDLNLPAHTFEISHAAAFDDAAKFAVHLFNDADSTSLQYRALRLFQEMLHFHLADPKPDALMDLDVERLQFMNTYGIQEDKNELYKRSLEQIIDKHKANPVVTQAFYLLAEWYMARGRRYDPAKDTTDRFAFLKARELCEKSILWKEDSEGKYNCANLLNEILRKEINLQSEKVNIPGQPFRILVSYRNSLSASFRLVKMDKTIRDGLGESWNDGFWKKILQLPIIKTFADSLPDTRDHQLHRAELKMDGLPQGEYALLASADNNFSLQYSALALQRFYVSNISYISQDSSYYILDRETGQPLKGAKVQFWQEYYDYKNNRQDLKKGKSYQSDKNGFLLASDTAKINGNNSFRLEITYGSDHLFMDDHLYNYTWTNQNTETAKNHSFLFSDRAIYRPGQIVYFKGIVVAAPGSKKKTAVVPNSESTIVLYDANEQPVDSIALTTNEFGAYSGKFALPANLLNGKFIIRDNTTQSDIRISVEEYKRPQFYVDIRKPAGTYKINDSIPVEGIAKSYAGNIIDGATVNYRVVRRSMVPQPFYSYSSRIWPPYPSEQIEIDHGTAVTDSEGKFNIRFKAIPDKNLAKKDQPVFNYEINANITDINGETRSGNVVVAVSYQALKLAITLPEKVQADSFTSIKILSTNTNEVFEKSMVSITVHKLTMPSKIFRERYWEEPDQFVLSREDYYRLFPYDLYRDENEMTKWPKEKKLFETTGLTSLDSGFSVQPAVFVPGWYMIEASAQDKYGELATATRYVQLYGPAVLSSIATGTIESNKNIAAPGEISKYRLGTNLDSVFMIHQVAKNDGKKTSLLLLNKESRSFEIPVTEDDRGAIGMSMAFIKHNRVYTNQLILNVPFTNKQLTIDYATYRDKTLPGSNEKWKVKIRGYHKDKLAAEVLTAMYDASLDQFSLQSWDVPQVWTNDVRLGSWESRNNFSALGSSDKGPDEIPIEHTPKEHDRLNTVPAGYVYSIRGVSSMALNKAGGIKASAEIAQQFGADEPRAPAAREVAADSAILPQQPAPSDIPAIKVRKNFNETAFFFPDLRTDSTGSLEFSFTTPESLTTWKWMLLAHTRELDFGYGEKSIITQKQLMVLPNTPRFLREGDRMDFSAKIVNMTNKEITGQIDLQLIDPELNTPLDGAFKNIYPNQYFTVAAGKSTLASFSIEIPSQYNKPITYRLLASASIPDSLNKKTTSISDGEEALLPVISNRILVTESLPLPIRGNTVKTFRFDKLLKSANSETLQNHALTVEFTTNPAWYAVQSLPYLAKPIYENAEQVFNRFYAHAVASKIANASARLKQVIEKWKTADTSALLSSLQKNEELRSALLEETPWVLEAKTESQQKKNIALLFDMVNMSAELESSIAVLQEFQSPNGGFVWFKGGPDDRYMTQYILSGIGHLKKLDAIPSSLRQKLDAITRSALTYLDKKILDEYTILKKATKKLPPGAPDNIQVQYLYMRSFFTDVAVPGEIFAAYNYYRNESKKSWLKQSRYMQGMIALSLFRTGEEQIAKEIMASLKQYAIVNEETGMYWKDMQGGYYWHQAPVEMQSLMIEAFSAITKDIRSTDLLKTWLLKNKQTNNWKTTRATADACYALLLQGTDWLTENPEVSISLGSLKVSPNPNNPGETEAGTGYFKKIIPGHDVKPSMGEVSVTMISAKDTSSGRPAWGSVYWQYFENMDKVSSAATPLKLTKKLFIEKNTDKGPVLEVLNATNTLHIGDKVKVRIELQVDRPMEYVHMKDMRASAMEPVNVLSSYKWQGGLGYYETTKDASTSFFFDVLRKGVYVFEYTLFVTHSGTFSNGITTIQSMYAPEFTSHSEGIKLNVESR